MDEFLARVSDYATRSVIRSCVNLSVKLTSTYVISQGSKLLKTVDQDPLRPELERLQRRLARKIELVSPILESIELRYTRGDSALEAIVRTARGLREDIDSLIDRLKIATIHHNQQDGPRQPQVDGPTRHVELFEIIADMKDLIISIDDAIPLINLWVSAIGGMQPPSPSFSPSRLLQASMLVNVGDTQFILDPSQPMQIGPDFTLSLYMLFRAHTSSSEVQEPYGLEEGQRKPMWQEVMHKTRVRLFRIPNGNATTSHAATSRPLYSYRLELVEDLDDGRLHTPDDEAVGPMPYNGLPMTGIRELIPVHQISKMFYADVGKILNIGDDDGTPSSPVLLLKRDVGAIPLHTTPDLQKQEHSAFSVHSAELICPPPDDSFSETNSQDGIHLQLQQESLAASKGCTPPESKHSEIPTTVSGRISRQIPQNLDPEWIALEVFDVEESDGGSDSGSTIDEGESFLAKDETTADIDKDCPPRHTPRPSIDLNLITQLNRMSIASSSRPSSSSDSHPYAYAQSHLHSHHANDQTIEISGPTITTTATIQSEHLQHPEYSTIVNALSPTKLIERSPFGAIKTSLSLLEMLLSLTSLQEFEQTTHLAIPDHVLKFYLGESVSTSGLRGSERAAAGAEAERKVGFDPYADRPRGDGER